MERPGFTVKPLPIISEKSTKKWGKDIKNNLTQI